MTIANTDSPDTYVTNEAKYTGADGGYNSTADMYITINASADFSVENYKNSLDAADYIIAYAGTTTADSKESKRQKFNRPSYITSTCSNDL